MLGPLPFLDWRERWSSCLSLIRKPTITSLNPSFSKNFLYASLFFPYGYRLRLSMPHVATLMLLFLFARFLFAFMLFSTCVPSSGFPIGSSEITKVEEGFPVCLH